MELLQIIGLCWQLVAGAAMAVLPGPHWATCGHVHLSSIRIKRRVESPRGSHSRDSACTLSSHFRRLSVCYAGAPWRSVVHHLIKYKTHQRWYALEEQGISVSCFLNPRIYRIGQGFNILKQTCFPQYTKVPRKCTSRASIRSHEQNNDPPSNISNAWEGRLT